MLPKKFRCRQCPESFTRETALVNHYMNTHEGAGPSSPRANQGEVACRHCGNWVSNRGLVSHIRQSPACKQLQDEWLQKHILLPSSSHPNSEAGNGSDAHNDYSDEDVQDDANEMEYIMDVVENPVADDTVSGGGDDPDNAEGSLGDDEDDSVDEWEQEATDSDLESFHNSDSDAPDDGHA
ncbi:C2H2 zinc finger [Ceratobasidium sp. AG-Ba]|nr:C2H2 zinc finger [Ceratobasidium sp. AG-Ba]